MSVNSHLVKAIVDMAVFLEFTNSELLDEDTAVDAMEQLAAELQRMTQDDQWQVAKQIIEFSTSYEQPTDEFVKGLPDFMGLSGSR